MTQSQSSVRDVRAKASQSTSLLDEGHPKVCRLGRDALGGIAAFKSHGAIGKVVHEACMERGYLLPIALNSLPLPWLVYMTVKRGIFRTDVLYTST
ncbi:hypothetical protein DD237_003681 [Peronospora effusa]|uniref:Uncharacterized protein n=1 Tax=Peronospora effusa TaxID=542832 RepID=A0A425BXC4_9STRA|nr:hypothetical protein DD237_003681 [Peronospora effusa]